MNKRLALFGAGIIVAIGGMATVNMTNFSLQQALNQLAGNNDAPYTRYSAQQAANLLLANTPTEHDTLPGVITFVWDDNVKELAPSHDSLYVQSMRSRGIVGGLAIEPENILYGDSTLSLTLGDVRLLVNSGWDARGTVGWDELSGLYHGNTGLLATGAYATPDTFYNNISRAVVAQRDTMGLGAPRWISHSNSSAAMVTNQAAALAGILFGYASGQTASAGAGDGDRPNQLYPVNVARYGAWGTGGSGSAVVAALPGLHLGRYEIRQTIGESNTFVQWKAAMDRAVQTKGLFVFIGHRPSVVGATMAGTSPFVGLDNTETFDSLMSYIKLSLDRFNCAKCCRANRSNKKSMDEC
jgi:hypothetical protein